MRGADWGDGTRIHRSASSRDGFAHDGSGFSDQLGELREIAMTGEIVKKSKAEKTVASAMDCVMPYNLWRVVYYCAEGDTEILRRIQDTYEFYGHATLPKKVLRNFRETFLTAEVSDYDTFESMKYNLDVHKYLACPHTAVALHAAQSMGLNNHDGENALVVLAARIRANS